MKALLISILSLGAAIVSAADAPIVLPELRVFNGVNDTVYTNLRSTKIEPDGVRFTHDGGIVKVSFLNLPEDIRAKCGYDPEKAAAYAQESRAASDAAAMKIAKDRAEATAKENEQYRESNAPPKPTGPVTQGDVKAVWYARLAAYKISPLDREREEKWAVKDALMEAIRTGKLDHRAAVFAHEYNAHLYRQNGEYEKAEKEQDRIREMERIAATSRLAAATKELSQSLNRLADVIASNPYRSYY